MKIQIFLASSIDEFKLDRLAVGDFINRLNKIYYKDPADAKYDKTKELFFVLEKCEDIDEAIRVGGKQGQSDDIIRVSDLVFLLFGKSVGAYTKHEFDVAYENFLQSNNPKIIIYIRTATDNGEEIVQDDSAVAFKKYLNDDIKHFWGTYSHIDTLLFKIIMNLIAINLSGINITVSGNALKEGTENILSLQNVPAWSANDAILQMENEINELQSKHKMLYDRWVDPEYDELIDGEYKKISEEFEEKRQLLKKLKADVFDDLCRATKAILNGIINDRLLVAYRFLEQGKYKEAKRILALDGLLLDKEVLYKDTELIGTIERTVVELKSQKQKEANHLLSSFIEGATVSRRLARTKEEWDKIEEYYETALQIAIDFALPKTDLFEYVHYLDGQRKVSKAIVVLKKLHEYLSELSSQQKAEFYHIAANLELKASGELKEVVYCFNNAFSYWFDLTKEMISEEQRLQLADLFMDIGHFWHGAFLNSKDNESVFAEAYRLLWQTRKVVDNIFNLSERKVMAGEASKAWLLGTVFNTIVSNERMFEELKLDDNIHRLMNSNDILAYIFLGHAYFINEPITISDNDNYRYIAYCKRAEILSDMGCIYLEISNYQGEEYLAQSLLYFAMSLADLKLISSHDLQDKKDFDSNCKIGRIHLNTSSVFRKLQYFGKRSYAMTDYLANIIVLTAKTKDEEPDCVVDCECEEKAQIDKGIEIFENLYQLNPLKYRNFLYTSYLMRSEFYDKRDLFDDAIRDCEKVIDLYKRLPPDMEASSGIYKSYIESELHLAHVYMRDRLNIPDKAVPHFENAIKTCADLSAKLPDEHEWKLVEIYSETARAYGALGEFEKAKKIVFDKSHNILLKLLSSDHRCNDGMWDKWLTIVELFFGRMQQDFNEGSLDGKVWIDWINTTWTYLIESYNKWLEEVKKDVNILLPIVCRYVGENSKEDFVIKHFQEQYDTILFRIVRTLTVMFMCYNREEEAIKLLTNALETYNTLSKRVIGSSGILRQSIYFHEVRRNEYKKLEELLKSIDSGAFESAVEEFHRLEAKVVFEHANPVESNGMTWENIAEIYREIIAIADKNANFAEIHKDDIADCYGHLGYVLFMDDKPSEAEKYLDLKIRTLKSIETYDLPNEYAFMILIVEAQICLCNFYKSTDEFAKAVETWTEALDFQLKFVSKHGVNVFDETKAHAGFVGSMTPLLNEEVVNVILRNMSYTMEEHFNADEGEGVRNLFNASWETIKAIGAILPQPAFSMIPFLFYEFIFGIKDDFELVKQRRTELINLINKYYTEADKRTNDDNPGSLNAIHPLDTSRRTMRLYAYIKNLLTEKLSNYFDDFEAE